jgi:hypothetical protein
MSNDDYTNSNPTTCRFMCRNIYIEDGRFSRTCTCNVCASIQKDVQSTCFEENQIKSSDVSSNLLLTFFRMPFGINKAWRF